MQNLWRPASRPRHIGRHQAVAAAHPALTAGQFEGLDESSDLQKWRARRDTDWGERTIVPLSRTS